MKTIYNMILLSAMVVIGTAATNDIFLRGADGQCTRCELHNCCSNGLKCKADGHDGICTTCKGKYESPCGDKCCNSGEECNGGSCTIPLAKHFVKGEQEAKNAIMNKAIADGQCTRCELHNCCSNGLKCKADGHDGICTTCKGKYESPCGNKCCNSGEECNGGSCTIPLKIQIAEH